MSGQRRMGMTGLREFDGQVALKSETTKTTKQVDSTAKTQPVEPPQQLPNKPKQEKAEPKVKAVEAPKQEKLTTVNIKIPRSQHEWLTDTARKVRDNNDLPVPASDRIYPQHLIQVAVDLLKSSEIDWNQVRNADELRQALNL